jgi:hypothetical protein
MEIALIALITSVAVAGCYHVATTPRLIPVRVRSNRRGQRR